MRHPMQKIEQTEDGVIRFRENKIIRYLMKEGKIDLNQIYCKDTDGDFNKGDYTQLMQLIGYSVSGYGDLGTSPRKIVKKADKKAENFLK